MSENTTILVVGASGFIGQHILELLRKEDNITALAASRSADSDLTRRLDLTDDTTYASALNGVDRVFLLSPGGHADAFGLVAPFIHAIKDTGHVDHVVLMTAHGVQHDDTIALRRLELLLQETTLGHTILRPNWFMQNFQSFWYEGIKHHDVIALPAGDAKTAFVDTRDIAEAAVAALLNKTAGEYDLTGSEALTYEEAATILSEAGSKAITYQNLPPEAFKDILIGAGMSEEYTQMMLWLFQSVRDGFASPVTDHVQRLTQRPPRTLKTYAQDNASLF